MNRLIQLKSSRWAAMLLATVVAIITSICVVNATQTITTPNAAFVSYSLGTGANSAAITPASNRSVLVIGCSTSFDDQGVGQVTLQHILSVAIEWVGLESPSGSPSTIISGYSAAAGTHVVYLDFAHKVDIQVASADTIKIHNGLIGTVTGNVTLVW